MALVCWEAGRRAHRWSAQNLAELSDFTFDSNKTSGICLHIGLQITSPETKTTHKAG